MAITAQNNLRRGSKGDDVRALQTALNNYGYGLDVDGSFGAKTLAAVQDYQSKNGLFVDGVVGTKTWGSLTGGAQAANNAPSAAGAASSSSSSSSSSKTALQTVQGNRPTFAWNQAAPTYAPSNEPRPTFDYAQQAPTYNPNQTRQAQIEQLTQRVLNREPFQYDLNADMLYKQYADQYKTLGQRASADAQAQAAALSGGYGNSYGVTAGNQAYQNYLNQLNNMVPQLEERAYQRWLGEGQQAENQLNLLRNMEESDYGRYRDALSDYQNERNFAYNRFADDLGQWNNDRTFGYNQYQDALAQFNADRNFAYNRYADELGQWNADRAFEYQAEQDALDRALQEAALAAKSSGGSGGSGGRSGSGRGSSSKSSSSKVSGTSQANAVLNDLGTELQSFADANDSTGLDKFLKKMVSAGYINSQTATMLYNKYFPKKTTEYKYKSGNH